MVIQRIKKSVPPSLLRTALERSAVTHTTYIKWSLDVNLRKIYLRSHFMLA